MHLKCHKWTFPDEGGGRYTNMPDFTNTFFFNSKKLLDFYVRIIGTFLYSKLAT